MCKQKEQRRHHGKEPKCCDEKVKQALYRSRLFDTDPNTNFALLLTGG